MVFAVVWRVIGQFETHVLAPGKLHEPFNQLGTMAKYLNKINAIVFS
jgi:hypothetical protein